MKGPLSKLRRKPEDEEPQGSGDAPDPAIVDPPTELHTAVETDDQPTSAYDSPLVTPQDAAGAAGPKPAEDEEDPDAQPTIGYDGPLVTPPEQPTIDAAAQPTTDAAAAAPVPEPATSSEAWAPATGVAAAIPPPAQAPAPSPPADTDPAALQVASAPSFRDRGRLRRRLSYLRRVRELGFRDLGGLVFDLHRFGRDGAALVHAKLDALAVVDRELRALERVLHDKPQYIDLREPGIAACPNCAALHGSDARFCPSCGMRLEGPQPGGQVAAPPAGTQAPAYLPPTQPHSVAATPPPDNHP